MKVKTYSLKITTLFISLILLASCNMNVNSVDPKLLGTWKSEKIVSSEIGASSCLLTLKKNKEFEMQVSFDSGGIMVQSGVFEIDDAVMLLHYERAYGLENDKKVYEEEDHFTIEYQILKIGTSKLEIAESDGQKNESLILKKNCKKGEAVKSGVKRGRGVP